MTISEVSVRKPVTTAMIYVLVCVIAAIFVPRLGVAMFPSTTMPVLSVSTSVSNLGPEEVEKNVTEPLESALSAISGLESMTSTSTSSSSRIQLTFGYDRDLDDAYADIQQVLTRAISALPDEAGSPSIMKFDMSSMPIMRLTVKGDLSLSDLRTLADDKITPLLERVEGVASADSRGGADKQVKVVVSENRLRAYDITLTEISTALDNRNVSTSGGTLTENGMDYEIYIDEGFDTLDDIRQTVIATVSIPEAGTSVNRSNVVRLVDVAEVSYDYDYSGQLVYIDGVPGLYVSVSNVTDSNSATVAKAVRAALPSINAELPAGVEVSVISDDTTMITATMSQVYNSAIQGGILAMLIILLFLRSFKGTLIIGLSMPISILATLLVMALMDLTLNMMTMTGLILGIGMIVDSSIVVLDNMHRYREDGDNSAVAAIRGSGEMITAIVASTLTTLCVFLPILIYKAELEMLGQMFYEMVITVVASLTASLIVAVTLVPALGGSIIRLDTRTQKPLRHPLVKKIDAAIDSGFAAMENAYAKAIRFALRNRFLVLTFVVGILAVSILKFSSFGMSFAPSSSSDDTITITMTLPVGTDNAVTSEYLFNAQDLIKENVTGYESIIVTVGTGYTGEIQLNLPELEDQTVSAAEMKSAIQPLLTSLPNATFSFSSGRGFRSGSAIDVELKSNDSDTVSELGPKIVALLEEQVPGLTDVTFDLESGSPQYTLVIDRDKAAALGVSISTIATEIQSALNGITATTIQDGNDEIDVVVTLGDGDVSYRSDLSKLYVTGSSGKISLDSLVSFKETTAPISISREEGIRVNHVTASLKSGFTASKVQPLVEAAITDGIAVPDSVEIGYGGESRDLANSGSAMITVILIAVFLVFVVMAAQFESLVDPFIIFFSIPLLLIGVVWTYVITGQTFSLFSAVGIVALVGIVVNNGIVLVDFTNGLLKKKIPVLEACEIAGKSRLRPILMTSLTTIIATVPMGFFPGEGGEMMQPIGVTIVGGMASGAFMTLFVTPIMYSLMNKRRERRFDDPASLQNMLAVLDK